ncbi:hypothetical protein N665_0101s0011 [Sinapis alba]|nr:hypothetical protein N665_0101s0011 [Sinapis alba]
MPRTTTTAQFQTKSWVVAVQQKKSLKKYEYEIEESEGRKSVKVPLEIVDNANLLWEDFVIARFLETAPHVAKVHVILNKIWAFGDKDQKLDVYEMDSTTMRIRIPNAAVREKFIGRGMWNIAGISMVVAKWSPIEDESNKLTPLWVYLKNVPMTGGLDRLHPETIACTNFKIAKVCVKANLSQPLPTMIDYTIDGEEITVEYCYPWLPDKSEGCGKWGHIVAKCERKDRNEELDIRQEKKRNLKEQEEDEDSAKKVSTQNLEKEDGQIVEEWLTPEKIGRTLGKKNQELQYGAVQIITPSRFSALSIPEEVEKDTKEVKEKEENHIMELVNKEVEEDEDSGNSEDMESEKEVLQEELYFQRQSLPRESKTKHRVISEGVQVAKATSQGKASRKGWEYMSNYEHNALERIWVVWKSNVRLTPVFKSDQIITMPMKLQGNEDEFFCSFVYARNTMEERKEFWEDMCNHRDSAMFHNKAWIIMGGFNEVLEGFEHSGYDNDLSVYGGMREFQRVARHCCLSDISYQGPLFTWCNKREVGLICKKLDRVLVNDIWLHQFTQAYSVFESGGCSDHLRSRTQIAEVISQKRRPFKFTNVIGKMPEFEKLLQEYWSEEVSLFHSTSAMFRLTKKLKALKHPLRDLSKRKLGDLPRKVKEAFEILCEKQKQTMEQPTVGAIKEETKALWKWQRLAVLEEAFS